MWRPHQFSQVAALRHIRLHRGCCQKPLEDLLSSHRTPRGMGLRLRQLRQLATAAEVAAVVEMEEVALVDRGVALADQVAAQACLAVVGKRQHQWHHAMTCPLVQYCSISHRLSQEM